MLPILTASPDFLINLLEKGGLPALALGICFVIFMFDKRSQVKKDSAAQKEREAARVRESEQYNELMKAYEQIVHEFIGLTRDTSVAITSLSERVGRCPLRDVQVTITEEEPKDG